MKALLLLMISWTSWATNIPTNITSYSTNTTQNPPVTLCSSSTAKTPSHYYQLGSGYQVPNGVTFYSAQACGYGSSPGQSMQLGFTTAPFVDGTTFLPSAGVIVNPVIFLNTSGIQGAAITGCQVAAANFQGGSFPFLIANTAGTYELCVTGVNE